MAKLINKKKSIDNLIIDFSKCLLNDDIKISNASTLLVDLIEIQTQKESNKNKWLNSIYKNLPILQANNVGVVGEKLIQSICESQNIDCIIDGTKTKQKGGGSIGDGIIKNKSIEIKTSHLGSNSPTFQHELGETPWRSDYIIFIDVIPVDAYITIFKNFTQEQYLDTSFKCKPFFPTKSITRRKGIGNFKLDTSININEICVKNKYSIKIAENNISDIGNFIDKTII